MNDKTDLPAHFLSQTSVNLDRGRSQQITAH